MDSTALATHISCGRAVGLNKVVEIEWLAFYQQLAIKGVASCELRVLRRLHHKVGIAQMPDDDDARRCPSEAQPGVGAQLLPGVERGARHWQAALLAVVG